MLRLCILLIVTCILYSCKTEKNKEFIKYIHVKDGYSLLLPKGWNIYENYKPASVVVANDSIYNSIEDSTLESINIIISDYNKIPPKENFINYMRDMKATKSYEQINEYDIKKGDLVIYVVQFSVIKENKKFYSISAYTNSSDKNYLITCLYGDENNDYYQVLYTTIIKSFVLIK